MKFPIILIEKFKIREATWCHLLINFTLSDSRGEGRTMGDFASVASESKNILMKLIIHHTLFGMVDWKERWKNDLGGKEGSIVVVFCVGNNFFVILKKSEAILDLWIACCKVTFPLIFSFTWCNKNSVTRHRNRLNTTTTAFHFKF